MEWEWKFWPPEKLWSVKWPNSLLLKILMGMEWLIFIGISARTSASVEITMRPMRSARMVQVGSLSPWARHLTMDRPFTLPVANTARMAEGAEIFRQFNTRAMFCTTTKTGVLLPMRTVFVCIMELHGTTLAISGAATIRETGAEAPPSTSYQKRRILWAPLKPGMGCTVPALWYAPVSIHANYWTNLYDKPAMDLPRNMMHSPGEPMVINSKSFGPFSGQILVPDENGRRIVRLMPEEVDSGVQGAATLFYQKIQLRAGGVRIAMSPSGESIYYGSTTRGWQRPDEGIQRLTYNGNVPFHISQCSLTTDGFLVGFTQPIANPEKLLENTKARSFRFEYGYRYGSAQHDKQTHKILAVEKLGDNGPYQIKLDNLAPGRIFELSFTVKSIDGHLMKDPFVQYTLNRLKRPDSKHTATITPSQKGLDVSIGGKFFASYDIASVTKPTIWPIVGPSGQSMLRDYPMKKDTPGEAHDHIHHQGVFIGHEGTNGANFWHIDKKNSGTVQQRRLIETRQGKDRALIKTLNAWNNKEGKNLFADTRTLQFWGDQSSRTIDLEIHFHATNEPMTFPAFKDGFVGIRTHPDLRLTANPKHGVKEVFGQAVNSEGIVGKKIWGKRADWVHYFGKIDGKPSGIAFLSHPSNSSKNNQKAWWHARDYGLISANPFAPDRMGGDGPKTLAKGDSIGFRYQVIFHSFKTPQEAEIEERFSQYAQEAAHPTSIMPKHPGYPEDYLASGK